jgi:hypothetical protein
MHLPSAMIGEEEVANFGSLVSLCHSSLPVAASRQVITPWTPSVQTLPSPAAGVLRGPGKGAGGPVTAAAGYFSVTVHRFRETDGKESKIRHL